MYQRRGENQRFIEEVKKVKEKDGKRSCNQRRKSKWQ